MSETQEAPAEKTPKQKCEDEGGTWNAETETCTMPETPAEKAEASAKATDLTLTQRIDHVIRDVLDAKLKALELSMDKKIDDILKSKEVEMEAALRKGFGLDHDPVIHQSDLVAALRKAALKETDSDKRTPAPTATVKSTGPAGTQPDNPFDKELKKYTEAS